MAPQHVYSISSTANEDSTANTNPGSPSSFFRNRFSNASLLSLSSVRTLLPQYSVVDTLEESSTSSLSEVSSESTSCAPPSWNNPPAIEPPRYSVLNPRNSLILTWRASTATRFEIEGDPQPHQFRYSYPIRAKNPWATLHLHTRDGVPGNSKSLQNRPRVPRFWSCDPIAGTLQLDLDSPQNIQQITIMLNGSIILSSLSGGSLPFLSREFNLWDKSMGDPLQSDNTDSKSTGKKKIEPRLASGQYTFPFSFPFPSHADPITKSLAPNPDINSISPFRPNVVGTSVSSATSPTSPTFPSHDNGPKNTGKAQRKWSLRGFTSAHAELPSLPTYPLNSLSFASPMPQSFLERDIDPNVAYDLSVRIVHGRFKASSKIKTNIAYLPASEPLPVSQRRREAYEAGALLPCPMEDPEGWFSLPTVTSYGVVKIDHNLLHTKVDFTLHIAQPLSYTRGSVIPCFITIHSDGVEVAQLLSSKERPSVRLLRRVWHPKSEYAAENPAPDQRATGLTFPSFAYTVVPTLDMNLVTHELGRANWWIPSKDVVQCPNARHLEGEIHLSPDLQPSCDFQSFRIEYAVELLSFQTANFKPEIHPPSIGTSRKVDNVIASNPVEITTLCRQDEPVPTAYSEPPKTYHKRRVSSDKGTVIFEDDN